MKGLKEQEGEKSGGEESKMENRRKMTEER